MGGLGVKVEHFPLTLLVVLTTLTLPCERDVRDFTWRTMKLRCQFTAKNMKLYAFFNCTSIAATEKRPLSYKTSQSFHRPRYCGVQSFPLKMHYGGEKWGKIGEGVVGF